MTNRSVLNNTGTVPNLVTSKWLKEHFDDPDLLIFDATWHMPNLNRQAKKDYKGCHIPGAQFFDIDLISDPESDLPHMMPSDERMSEYMSKFGLTADKHVIIYDFSDVKSSARAWLMLKIFGHPKISILDGGITPWHRRNYPVTYEPTKVVRSNYHLKCKRSQIRTFEQMLEVVKSKSDQIIDARPEGRFSGSTPEPRAGLKSGHMPGSLNLPISNLFDNDALYLSSDKLHEAFSSIRIDFNQPITCTCGSGMTASVLIFALHLIGYHTASLYDGSWTQWGAKPDALIDTDKN